MTRHAHKDSIPPTTEGQKRHGCSEWLASHCNGFDCTCFPKAQQPEPKPKGGR